MTQSGNRRPRAVKHRRKLKGVQRFIITAAQNATPVHKGFMAALSTARENLNAELLDRADPLRTPRAGGPRASRTPRSGRQRQHHLFNVRKKLGRNPC